ncbi:MAG: Gfo/Idh/MocA family oxidoreductase [Candidatus Omnitrophica bacterium]|nr:Gfo/Idh/MocA family oxidoreductase [Candidatus Omnitrophota bacterium]
MKKPLRVGIAGFGVVGKVRRKFIDQHPRMLVTAVCDQSFAKTGGKLEGLSCFSSYKQLLAEPLDVLFVCLPNYLAPEVTIAGLEKGLHVFCEKPPGKSVEDILAVIQCERKHAKQKLMYGFNHRYHESVRKAMDIIRSGSLGKVINLRGVYGKSKIVSFDSDWRTKRALAGGGIFLDQGIHMVDLMRLFAGEFTEVHSYISNDFWKHDVEDNAYALMRTADGVVAQLHSSATQWRHSFNLSIALTKGSLILSGILSNSKSYGAETITIVRASANDGGDPFEEMIRYNEDNSWRDEVFDFASAVIGDKKVTGGTSLEALKTMKTVYRIYYADLKWRKKYNIPDPDRKVFSRGAPKAGAT